MPTQVVHLTIISRKLEQHQVFGVEGSDPQVFRTGVEEGLLDADEAGVGVVGELAKDELEIGGVDGVHAIVEDD